MRIGMRTAVAEARRLAVRARDDRAGRALFVKAASFYFYFILFNVTAFCRAVRQAEQRSVVLAYAVLA